MRNRSRIVKSVCVAVVIVSCASPAAAKKKRTPCPAARFVIDGEPLIGENVSVDDAVAFGGDTLSIDSGCGAASKLRVKARKKVTKITAIWKSCTDLAGKVKLTAKIDSATCSTVRGKLKAKKAKLKRKFTGQLAAAPTLTTGSFTDAPLTQTTVGSDGGTIAVTDTSSPLNGLEIVVPSGAADETISFQVSYADITGESGLPTGASSTSKVIRVTASGSDEWNDYRIFSQPLRVTLPYEAPSGAEETVRFYVLNADGTLEPAGMEGQDEDANTITFHTSVLADTAEASRLGSAAGSSGASEAPSATTTFISYIAVGLAQDALATLFGTGLGSGRTVNTGFLPTGNGWRIPNYGSFYKDSRGGSCFGFVGAAKYYYRKRHSPKLYDNYRDSDNSATWVDDGTAIEFTSRVHNAMSDIWDKYVTGEVNIQKPSSRKVALSFIGGMYVTGSPVLLYIQQAIPKAGGGTTYSGAHAISIYRADVSSTGQVTFHVYDPNFPGDNTRRITYSPTTGFASYPSGTSAASSRFSYNYFKHVGFHVGLSDAALDKIKTSADNDFKGDSVFSKITITSITGANTGNSAEEGVTDNGDHKYIIDDNAVRIQGTILGGLAQDACCVVNNARVFLSNKRYSTPVNNSAGSGDGTFDVKIPISQGESELVIIAAKRRSYSHWAAFLRDVIESTFSVAALEITYSWDQNQSDGDLYVKEPDGDGTTGDTVYWLNRKGASTTNPYLDFDNTTGYGPQHYVAVQGMKTVYTNSTEASNLYGTYTVKSHYYADHDDNDESTQPITWHVYWRYLAFCPDPCGDPEADGFWEEGSFSGAHAVASSGNCCNINNSGADWSQAFSIDYEEPDPDDWVVPDPPGVMLP